MMSAGGAGGSCAGANCPQCTVDADCEKLGMHGATCADAMCWAPTAECTMDSECVSRGPEFDGGRCVSSECRPNPRWRCEKPPIDDNAPGMKTLSVLVRDSLSLSPLPNIRAVACQKLDLQCSKPVAEAKTGSDGKLMIMLPSNFAGYLQQTDRTDYAPAMYFLPATFPADGVLEPFPLLAAGVILDALATTLGGSIDPMRGNMMLIAEDCMGMALSGVSFSCPQGDDKTVQFYVRNLLPSTSATETAEVGNGGYLNVPAGTAVISLKMVKSGLDLTTITVVVRAGFISVAYIRPELR
jgi:hypothetical protein